MTEQNKGADTDHVQRHAEYQHVRSKIGKHDKVTAFSLHLFESTYCVSH